MFIPHKWRHDNIAHQARWDVWSESKLPGDFPETLGEKNN